MRERDRHILMLIEFLADDYIARRFTLADFSAKLEELVEELQDDDLHDAFDRPLGTLHAVLGLVNGEEAMRPRADMRLEGWAIRRAEAIARNLADIRPRASGTVA